MRFSFAKQRTLSSRCSGDRASRIVVDHLRINMFPGKMDCQARPLRGASNFFPDPSMNALSRCLTKRRHAIERSCLPCDESARLRSEHLCPCKVPADKNGGYRLQLVPLTFYPRPEL